MARRPLGDPGALQGSAERPLDDGLMQVMAPALAGPRPFVLAHRPEHRSPPARNRAPRPGPAPPRAAAPRTRTAPPPLAPAYHASRAVPPTLRPASIPPEGARTALLEPGRRTVRAADLTRHRTGTRAPTRPGSAWTRSPRRRPQDRSESARRPAPPPQV